MNEQEIIQQYEQQVSQMKAELASVKSKVVELQQAKNDYAIQNEIFQKDILNKEIQISNLQKQSPIVQKKKRNGAWIILLAFIGISLGILSIYYYSETTRYATDYYTELYENQSLKKQINQLQEDLNTQITNLKNEINRRQRGIANRQALKTYKVITSQAKCYKWCGGKFEYIDCTYENGTILSIFTTQQDYGLSYGGWVKMSDLEKY
jgi:hypothetical protein